MAYVPLADEDVRSLVERLQQAKDDEQPNIEFDLGDAMHFANEIVWLRSNVLKLLKLIAGEPNSCRFCGKPVFWVQPPNGKKAPYTPLGLNHWADCEKAPAR